MYQRGFAIDLQTFRVIYISETTASVKPVVTAQQAKTHYLYVREFSIFQKIRP